QHRSSRGPQVCAHLADTGGQAQRPERGKEDLGGEGLRVGAVADPSEQRAIHPGRIGLVYGFPVGGAVVGHRTKRTRADGFVLCRHVPPSPINISSGYTRVRARQARLRPASAGPVSWRWPTVRTWPCAVSDPALGASPTPTPASGPSDAP